MTTYCLSFVSDGDITQACQLGLRAPPDLLCGLAAVSLEVGRCGASGLC
jgi:hypothetical protein